MLKCRLEAGRTRVKMGRKLRHRQAEEKAKQGKLVQKAKDQANSTEEPASAAEAIVKLIRTETNTN